MNESDPSHSPNSSKAVALRCRAIAHKLPQTRADQSLAVRGSRFRRSHDRVLEEIQATTGQPLESEQLRRISPTYVERINLRGTSNFSVARYARRILQVSRVIRPLRPSVAKPEPSSLDHEIDIADDVCNIGFFITLCGLNCRATTVLYGCRKYCGIAIRIRRSPTYPRRQNLIAPR
jgi:hypothetical protein